MELVGIVVVAWLAVNLVTIKVEAYRRLMEKNRSTKQD